MQVIKQDQVQEKIITIRDIKLSLIQMLQNYMG